MMINQIPEGVQGQLDDLSKLRDLTDREINFRRLSGRRYNSDLKDFSDLELNQAAKHYRSRIDALLAPYER